MLSKTPALCLVILLACPAVASAQEKIFLNEHDSSGDAIDSEALLAQKRERIKELFEEASTSLGREFDPRWRARAEEALLGKSIEQIESLSSAPQGSKLERLIGASLGSGTGDWVFTKLPACRILDTRPATQFGSIAGALVPGTTYHFKAAGLCGIPFPTARVLVLNVIATQAGGPGSVRLWAYDQAPTPPTYARVTYTSSEASSNEILQPVCDTATATGGDCSFDLSVKSDNRSTHLLVDVYGYFAPPEPSALNCTVAAKHFSSSTSFNESVVCPEGYTRTGGGLDVQGLSPSSAITWRDSSPGLDLPSPVQNGWSCRVINGAGDAVNAHCYAICCRIP